MKIIGIARKAWDGQGIKARDVVIIHDDFPRINWKLAVVERLITGGLDGIARARTAGGKLTDPSPGYFHWRSMRMRIRMNSLQTLLQQMPWTRLLVWFHTNRANLPGKLAATIAACRKLKEWTDVLHAAPEDVIV